MISRRWKNVLYYFVICFEIILPVWNASCRTHGFSHFVFLSCVRAQSEASTPSSRPKLASLQRNGGRTTSWLAPTWRATCAPRWSSSSPPTQSWREPLRKWTPAAARYPSACTQGAQWRLSVRFFLILFAVFCSRREPATPGRDGPREPLNACSVCSVYSQNKPPTRIPLPGSSFRPQPRALRQGRSVPDHVSAPRDIFPS